MCFSAPADPAPSLAGRASRMQEDHDMISGKTRLSRVFTAAVILVGVYFAAQLAIKLSTLWILIFGSVVVAVILRSIADPLVRRTRLNDGVATLVAVLIVVLIVSAVSLLLGSTLMSQAAILAERVPRAWETLVSEVKASPFGDRILGMVNSLASGAVQALLLARRVAVSALSGITTLVLVMVAGVFLATKPSQSREGALSLVPIAARARLRDVLNACGRALKGWLRAQLVSMLLVGTLVSLGLWAIGIPSALALGVLTGLAQFVPIVGPIVSAVPALLVAATEGPDSLLLTLILYVGVSQLEANLITPLVQKNVASLPVVLGIFAVVGIGSLFGPLGVLFATPLALVLHTIVTMLYRHDILGDLEARAPGELPARKRDPEAGDG